ncbi:hypothetical protein ACFLIM_48630 [Nonomuraea sp. M3C6]|uniref:Uncharacterized protein n=1 Tax=Nonomuraea marmarensis TaxID=3351344 RepID=A0ABW7AXY3_9ACTN
MINPDSAETIGWPRLAEQVTGVYRNKPAAERPRVRILASNYGEAIDDGATIAVGFGKQDMDRFWSQVTLPGTLDNGIGLDSLKHALLM